MRCIILLFVYISLAREIEFRFSHGIIPGSELQLDLDKVFFSLTLEPETIEIYPEAGWLLSFDEYNWKEPNCAESQSYRLADGTPFFNDGFDFGVNEKHQLYIYYVAPVLIDSNCSTIPIWNQVENRLSGAMNIYIFESAEKEDPPLLFHSKVEFDIKYVPGAPAIDSYRAWQYRVKDPLSVEVEYLKTAAMYI